MNKLLAVIIGAAMAVGAANFSAMAAPAVTEPAISANAGADWSEGGRWLVPYGMPGYAGYSERWPAARRAEQPARGPASSGADRPPT